MTYVPSAHERQRAADLLAMRTPERAEHEEYLRQVANWMDRRTKGHYIALPEGRREFTHVGMRKSQLFGRKYLVAFLEKEHFVESFPVFDALAIPGGPCKIGYSWAPLTIRAPTIVVAPDTRLRARSETFRSILEHEFVHVNQMLLGVHFTGSSGDLTAERHLFDFFEETRIEYEANLIQLTTWPQLFLAHQEVSLDRWCVLRGYTAALERAFTLTVKKTLPIEESIRFLRALPGELARGFERAGIDSEHVGWFQENFHDHCRIAAEHTAMHQADFVQRLTAAVASI